MSDRGQCSPAGTDFGLREIPWGTGRLLNSEGSGKGKRNVILNRLGHIFKQSDAVWHFLALLPLAFPHGLRDFTAFVRNFTATAENCSRSNPESFYGLMDGRPQFGEYHLEFGRICRGDDLRTDLPGGSNRTALRSVVLTHHDQQASDDQNQTEHV